MPDALRLRRATPADAPLLLAWRNDAGTLASLRGHRCVEPDEHEAWLRRAVNDPDVLLCVAELDGAPVGVCRLNRTPVRILCSITVAPECRGHGYARRIIEAMCDAAARVSYLPVDAEILTTNLPSQRAFASAGFKLVQALGAGEDAIVVMRWQK